MIWKDVPAIRTEGHYGDRVVKCFADRPGNVDQILRETVKKHGGRDAVIDGARRFTYSNPPSGRLGQNGHP